MYQQIVKSMAIVAVLLGMVFSTAIAQEGVPTTSPYTITVTGFGDASAPPDMATLIVGVENGGSDITELYQEVNSTIATITAALEGAGVTDADMRTDGLDVYVNRGGYEPEEIRVSNRIHITIRDLSKIEEIIDLVVQNGANSIYGLSFGLEENADIQTEARLGALDDARQRAESIAQHLGVELSEVISITEQAYGNVPMGGGGNAMMGLGGDAVVEPGMVVFTMSVTVTYHFTPASE